MVTAFVIVAVLIVVGHYCGSGDRYGGSGGGGSVGIGDVGGGCGGRILVAVWLWWRVW